MPALIPKSLSGAVSGATVAVILGCLWNAAKKEDIRRQQGWHYILAGFAFILFATLIDLTDNLPGLSEHLILGDIECRTLLEKVAGYLPGSILLAIGFRKWVQTIISLREHEGALRNSHHMLETTIAQLYDTNEQLRQEIDDRKWVEASLRESENDFCSVVEQANEAMVVIQEGRLHFVNPKSSEILKYSMEELSSRPFIEFVHPDDRKMVLENHFKRLKGDQVTPSYQLRVIDKEGIVRWIEINAVRIEWQGKPAVFSLLYEVTQPSSAETEPRGTGFDRPPKGAHLCGSGSTGS